MLLLPVAVEEEEIMQVVVVQVDIELALHQYHRDHQMQSAYKLVVVVLEEKILKMVSRDHHHILEHQ
tara:strand:+ start:422 stop:622 length:201 start_codon:yes stop_codon:yes gene_type:complete